MARKPMDLTNRRFTRLLVVGFSHYDENRIYFWNCQCDCGKATVLSKSALTGGKNKSCGCLRREAGHTKNLTHGATKERKWTGAYKAWARMWERVRAPEGNKNYQWYGARGIYVCERWNRFEAFLADMGERPVGMSLDRYPNNDGDYEPGNCRWATAFQQVHNRRPYVRRKHPELSP